MVNTLAIVIAGVLVAFIGAVYTPENTSALAAQIDTRACMVGGDSVSITIGQTVPRGYHAYLFQSSTWWMTWIPATLTRLQQCMTWTQAAAQEAILEPGSTITFTIPDEYRAEFWFLGIGSADCSKNVSGISYNLTHYYSDTVTNEFECMPINERTWSEIMLEWSAIRSVNVFDVAHIDTFSVVVLYITFAIMTTLCIIFAITSGRSVTRASTLSCRLSVLACLMCALTYYTLATGTGFAFVYRTDGGWTWSDTYASLMGIQNQQTVVVFPIALSRFVIRPLSLGLVVYIMSQHMGYIDWYVGATAVVALTCQFCATLVLSPSKWVMAFIGWICTGAMFRMIHSGSKQASRAYATMIFLWLLDALVWVSTDALHTVPVWLNIVSHAMIDSVAQGFILLALRRGAYKRTTAIDLGLDEPEPCLDATGAALEQEL